MAENCKNTNINFSPGTVSSDSGNVSSDHSTQKKPPFTPPWTQIVRKESDAMMAGSSSPKSSSSPRAVVEQAVTEPPAEECVEDGSGSGSGNAGKKPVWSRPSNGAAEVGSLMDAQLMDAQWPDLSESARVSFKPSRDSSKVLCNGSSSSTPVVSKGTGNASVSQRQSNNTANSNSVPNHSVPGRQRSMKRNGAGSSSNGVLSQPLPSGSAVESPLQSPRDHTQRGRFRPQPHGSSDHSQHQPLPSGSAVESPSQSPRDHTQRARIRPQPHGSSDHSQHQPLPSGSAVESPLQSPSRDHAQRGRVRPQPHGSSDHSQHHNSFRNRNSGFHPNGNGSHSHNYGGRRNQDHGNQDWNQQRNFNGRGVHMQPQRGFPMFFGNPPPLPLLPQYNHVPLPYMAAPYGGPFVNPYGFSEFPPQVYWAAQAHPDSLRGVPYTASMPPSDQDDQLHDKIVHQIDYYFSDENLVTDTYLRLKMDDQGWVPIEVIASFNKVSRLTNDIQLILNALQSSDVVEVQDEKIRKKNDWSKWILPASVPIPYTTSPRSGESSSRGMLANGIQTISLNQNASNRIGASNQENNHAESSGRSLSGELNNEEGTVPNEDR